MAVRDEIRDEVEPFVQRHHAGHRMLGLHYRGTDKSREAPPVGYDLVKRHLHDLLETGRFQSVFVTSDDQRFVDAMLGAVSGGPVSARDDSDRSTDGNPVHLGRRPGRVNTLGRDALVNCMLLSRCDSVLRSSSFLSAWASIFNPDLRVYLMNRPRADTLWFPEREIPKDAIML